MDPKDSKKLYSLLSKTSNVFTDIYITVNGYIVTMDIEKPFLIQVDDKWIRLLSELLGQFRIIHIPDLKNFKKAMKGPSAKDDKEDWPKLEDQYYEVVQNDEINGVTSLLTNRINEINSCDNWESFVLSDNADENMKLIRSLFVENNYISFSPKDNSDSPDIIMTKSLIPLVNEKNYTDLYYSTKKIDSDLYMIIFDLQFDLFRVYMYHYYIPFKES